MLGGSDPINYYFDDKAPDGWHEYHLQRIGVATPRLFRNGEPIREVLDPIFVEENKLLQDRVLWVLEYFVRNAGKALRRLHDFGDFGDIQPELTKLRKLFNDLEETHRVIQKAGKGALVFTPPVRSSPSKYLSTYRTDLRHHWKPRAMGSGTLFHSDHWYFSGRTAVLCSIVDWLSKPASGGTANVITGDPGSGKSAVLGFIVTCSDQNERTNPACAEFLTSLPQGCAPPAKTIDFAINLHNRNLNEVLAILADRFRCDNEGVIRALIERGQRTILVFDGLDESPRSSDIATFLLRALAGYDHLWLLVGARRPSADALGEAVEVHDLDTPDYYCSDDLERYVEGLLKATGETRRSPYKHTDARYASRAVAAAARGNFLVAFIVAQSLIEREHVLNPDSQELPTTPRDAFREYLRQLGDQSGLGYWRLRQMLVPLACAQGQGMPKEVWSRLAGGDVDMVLEFASAFVPCYGYHGKRLFRLFHEALADAIRVSGSEKEEHTAICKGLIDSIPHHDWSQSDWYTLTFLAIHAERAGMLDQLIRDTSFLAAADPHTLASTIHGVASDETRRRSAWHWIAVGRLGAVTFGERMSYLELVALQIGALDLAKTIDATVAGPWRTRWVHWTPPLPHATIRWGSITSIAIAQDVIICIENREWAVVFHKKTCAFVRYLWRDLGRGFFCSLAAVFGDWVILNTADGDSADFLLRWNWRTGERVGPYYRPPKQMSIEAIAIGGSWVAAGGQWGEIYVWDLETGELLNESPYILSGAISALALDDDQILAGDLDGNVGSWNLRQHQSSPHLIKTDILGTDSEVVGLTTEAALIRSLNRTRLTVIDFEGRKLAERTISERQLIIEAILVGDKVIFKIFDGPLFRWNWRQAIQKETVIRGQEVNVTALAASSDMIVCAGEDQAMKVWRLGMIGSSTDAEIDSDCIVNCVAITKGRVVSADADAALRSWELNTGNPQGHRAFCHEGTSRALAVRENLIVSGGWDGSVRVWDSESLKPLGEPFDAGRFVSAVGTNTAIVCAGTANGVLILWDLKTRCQLGISDPHNEPITSISIEDDCILYTTRDEMHAWRWMSSAAAPISYLVYQGVTVTSLRIDSRFVVATFRSYGPRLWYRRDLSDWTWFRSQQSHGLSAPEANSAAILGNTIVTGGLDGILYFSDAVSLDVIGTIDIGSVIINIAVEPNTVIAATNAGLLRLDVPWL